MSNNKVNEIFLKNYFFFNEANVFELHLKKK